MAVAAADAQQPAADSRVSDPLVQCADPIQLRDADDQPGTEQRQRLELLRQARRNSIPDQLGPIVGDRIPSPQPSWNPARMDPSLAPQETLEVPVASIPESESNNAVSDPGFTRIGQVGTDISLPRTRNDSGVLPPLPRDYATKYFSQQPPQPRNNDTGVDWLRSEGYGPPLNFCYRPLYFEEMNLERYGYSWGILQPVISAGRFYGNAAVLPFRLAHQRPGYRTYHEHCYRPGAPAPREFPVLGHRTR